MDGTEETASSKETKTNASDQLARLIPARAGNGAKLFAYTRAIDAKRTALASTTGMIKAPELAKSSAAITG